MGEKELGEAKGQEATVGFGTLFEVKGISNRIDVVLDVGEGNSFASAKIIETRGGKKALAMAGTAGPHNIEEIIGQLSFDEVIDVFGEGTRMRGYELSDEERELLKGYSRKEPRVFRLTNF